MTDVAGRGDFFDGTNGYSTKEYYYDKNGNIWIDRNKKMKTLYNYLNLPSRVSDTITPANKIEYVYTSAGEKLKQRLSTGTTLLYLGNYVYTLDGTANGIAVKYILTQEGRATYSAGTYTYEYFMKDHLGSTRVSFNVPSTTAVIVQQDDYYPFGMIHRPQTTTTSDNRYLYNGKELQNNLLGGINLDLYDYGFRYYDPQIARWHVVDPAAEMYRKWSPYAYCLDNPVRFIDPDGMVPGDPTKDPQIRENRASNLFGQVRTANGVPNSKNHQGFDYVAAVGTDALAIENGTVVAVQTEEVGDYGRTVTIQITDANGNTRYAFYAHLETVSVTVGQVVSEGDVVGTTGTSGNADANSPHLHFENRTEQAPGTGLTGRETPNSVVDTDFNSQDPNATQTTTGVQKVVTNADGTTTTTNMDIVTSTTTSTTTTTTPPAPTPPPPPPLPTTNDDQNRH